MFDNFMYIRKLLSIKLILLVIIGLIKVRFYEPSIVKY